MEANDNLDEVVEEICLSIGKQSNLYKDLISLAKKISGKVALSRGNFTEVVSLLEKKEQILNNIIEIKDNLTPYTQIWQEKKKEAPEELAQRVNDSLDTLEKNIKSFLQTEKQLEKQVSFYSKK